MQKYKSKMEGFAIHITVEIYMNMIYFANLQDSGCRIKRLDFCCARNDTPILLFPPLGGRYKEDIKERDPEMNLC